MKKYEIMYIIRPNLESEETKSLVANLSNIFTERQSEVLELKEIGLKDLAYEIDHLKKGYYVWTLVNATNEAVEEFNRVVRITENVIRYIVVKDGE
ncbi:MAG: 30S ribosomal protein S6 [Tenericutes bacterium HGW-Tenericutes-8]|nr:MAG: 30S ribosomal protein S6 [Tenericutes bacterium HGW-Tenericutes-8]